MSIPNNPNKYLGTRQYLIPYVTRGRQPTLADYRQPETGANYPLGCVWQVGRDPSTGIEGELWMLSKIVANQGYWVLVSSSSGNVVTLSDDVDTIVYPDGTGNIQLVGHVNEQGATKFSTVVSGTNLLNLNPMSSYRWIVDPLGFNGTHTTLTSAMASATSGDTICIVAGSQLTENVTLKAGVNIVSDTSTALAGSTTIIGKLSASFAGSCSISGVELQTNGDAVVEITGSASTTVYVKDCLISAPNATPFNMNTSTTTVINLLDSIVSTLSNVFTLAGASGIIAQNCIVSGTTTPSTSSSTGGIILRGSIWHSPVSLTAGFIEVINCEMNVGNAIAVNIGAACAASTVGDSLLTTGSSSCINIDNGGTAVISSFLSSSNTNVISGSGRIFYSKLTFFSSKKISVTSQDPYVTSNDCYKVTTPAAYPYTVLPTDKVVLVDTTAATAITVENPLIEGQNVYIKDATGNAAAMNITITASAGNIDGAANLVIAANYGKAHLMWDGTEWVTL